MELKRCKAAVVWKDEEEDTKMELKRCKTAEQFNSMELQRCKIAEKFNSMDLKRCKEDTKMESESEAEAEAWLSVAPDDILVQILMRLPNSKDALQCKLVSKHWNSVISNPSFLRQGASFHRHNYTNTVEGDYSFSLIFQLEQCLPSKSKSIKNPVFALEQSKGGGDNQNNACVRPLYLHRLLIGNSSSSSSLSLSEWELKIGASCDDLLLVEYKRKKKNKEFKYYVVNLQTHEWIDLPPPPATALAPPTLEDNTLLGGDGWYCKELKESKRKLKWALELSNGKQICLINVHVPPKIENEYGPVEHELDAPGKAYTNWATKMALGLSTGVPWVMCKHEADAYFVFRG